MAVISIFELQIDYLSYFYLNIFNRKRLREFDRLMKGRKRFIAYNGKSKTKRHVYVNASR